METYVVVAIVIVLLLVLAAFAYEKGWLNGVLPTRWQKRKAHFVGAYGRTPGMQGCLALDPTGRWPYFNRCIHV
jgi:hypothetical protein